MPPAERYAHGTLARYVARCRCDLCRGAIRQREADRARRVHEAAAEVQPNLGPPVLKKMMRAGVEITVPACPGTGGKPCVGGGTWLRTGRPVCLACVDRAAVWNGMVDAAPVRAHLLKLRRQGLGHKTVAAAADVGATTLSRILWGEKKLIRAQSAARVLAVTKDAIADGGRVPAGPTLKLVGELLAAGLTKQGIARRLGQKGPSLQIGPRYVQARTALTVKKLLARVTAESDGERFVRDAGDPRFVDSSEAKALLDRIRVISGLTRKAIRKRAGLTPFAKLKARCTPGTLRKIRRLHEAVVRQAEVDRRAARHREIEEGGTEAGIRLCSRCGSSHDPARRQERLARLLPADAEAIRDALPCLYLGEAGYRSVGLIRFGGQSDYAANLNRSAFSNSAGLA
jgi:hypothetical protein